MKKSAKIAVALTVAVTTLSPLAQPAQAATRLGGVDVWGWCNSVNYREAATSNTGSPYSWYCRTWHPAYWLGATFYGAGFWTRGVDMNAACSRQYGRGAYARVDAYNAWGWKCYR